MAGGQQFLDLIAMGTKGVKGPTNVDRIACDATGALWISVKGAAFIPFGGASSLPQTSALADATTVTAPDGIVERHTTSGTAAAGFGLTNAVELQNGSGTLRRASSEVTTLTTVTDAAEVAKWVLNLMNSGTLSEVVDFSWPNSTLAMMNLGGFGQIIRASTTVLQILAGAASGLQVSSGNVTTVSANLQCDQRFYQKTGASVASATTVTLGNDGNVFPISGVTTINGITTSGWTSGAVVYLKFAGILTVTHNSGAPGGGAVAIKTTTNANVATTANSIMPLLFDGTFWVQLSTITPGY